MPVVISLLNSFTGLTAAAAGLIYDNQIMLLGGVLVGASGTILTVLMCEAMNRHIFDVLFGSKTGYAPTHAYSVLGIGENAELGRYVVLYNPWGKFEGRADGANDGVFRVPLSELKDNFSYFMYSSELWHLSIR